MKNKWLIALYKINEVKRVEANLSSQKFKYYLPKITTTKTNSNPKVEVLFPGYIFINTSSENYSVLKYTKGIKDILKFGDKISSLSSDDIKAMQVVEKTSKSTPLVRQLKIGQDAFVKKGSLKGNIVKICSLPSKERVGILLHFLGSVRRVLISEKDLIF